MSGIISFKEEQDIQNWKEVQDALQQHIQAIQDDKNVEWIVNAQFTSRSSPNYYSQFSAREEPYVLDLDKYAEEKLARNKSSIGYTSELDSTNLMSMTRKLSEKTSSTLPMSPKLVMRSQLFSSFHSKLSAKQELRRNLLYQIDTSNHIILGLISSFASICNSLFEPYFDELTWVEYTTMHREIYHSICEIIRRFIKILKTFVCWIYEDLLAQLENGLDQEDLNSEYVIESVLYDMLFRAPNFTLKSLISQLLNLEYRNEVIRFKEILNSKKEEHLEDYDKVLKKSRYFLLESVFQPYREVFKKMKYIQLETNPYGKFENMMSLEEEMWNCINQCYKSDNELVTKLKESFGMDVRFPIMIYCIVQSQCETLLIERKFVEEFVNPNILDTSLGFTTFKSGIDFLLHDNGPEHFDDIEIRGLDEKE